MTPTDRFEKIKQILIDCQDGKLDEAVYLIAAQITEAEQEAYLKGLNLNVKSTVIVKGYREGFADARTKAAAIAEKWGDSAKGNILNTGYVIADEITAMEP